MNIPHHSTCLQPYNPKKSSYATRWVRSGGKLTQDILRYVWSPILFKAGRRRQADFLYADWLVLDFDSGETTLEMARDNLFADCYHLIAPTRSHTPDHHRFRVCLLFEKRIQDLETFRFNMAHYIEKYGADNQCKDGARYFFPSPTIFSKHCELGLFKQEVLTPPDNYNQEIRVKKGEFSLFVMRHVGKTIPKGRRDVTTWAFARDLAKAGFSEGETKGFIQKWLKYEGYFNFEAKVETVFKQLTEKM